MTDGERAALLCGGLFAGMSAAAGERLLRCLAPAERFYKKNERLWRVGDRVTACAVILSGAVVAESAGADGRREVLARHGPGSLVGDVLMTTPGAKSPVDVTAAVDTTAAVIQYSAIMGGCEKCCRCHARLRENLISEIAAKYWDLRRKLRYLSAPSMRQRISMRLLDEYERVGSATFSLEGTREELADYLGVNRSALSRELGRMRAEGLIDFYRDSFRIVSPEKLRSWGSAAP